MDITDLGLEQSRKFPAMVSMVLRHRHDGQLYEFTGKFFKRHSRNQFSLRLFRLSSILRNRSVRQCAQKFARWRMRPFIRGTTGYTLTYKYLSTVTWPGFDIDRRPVLWHRHIVIIDLDDVYLEDLEGFLRPLGLTAEAWLDIDQEQLVRSLTPFLLSQEQRSILVSDAVAVG